MLVEVKQLRPDEGAYQSENLQFGGTHHKSGPNSLTH